MNGGVASVERSSKKWTCASPQAQADNNYTTPPTGEQERLERLEKKVGWFDVPKKPRRPLARSDESRMEMLNQVAKKLNFQEESSPSLSSSSSMSPNTLTSPFGHLKISPQSYQLGHSSQFTPTQQRTTGGITITTTEVTESHIVGPQQQQQQQQQQHHQQNESNPQNQNQNRGDILASSQGSQQFQVGLGSQQRYNPINRCNKPLQQAINNNHMSNQNNNNNNNITSSNILKFR